MSELRYTLLSDGSSDRALVPVLTWLLKSRGVALPIQPDWADPGRFPKPPRGLSARIEISLEFYPCDLLFVHRDAERDPYERRKREILEAVREVMTRVQLVPPAVCVVPVRMQEAWFLFSENAIRAAAGNPHGRVPLQLPRLAECEGLPSPKQILYDLLREASDLPGRRRQKLPVRERVHRVAEFIEDFSPLRNLPAFAALDRDVEIIVHEHNWTGL